MQKKRDYFFYFYDLELRLPGKKLQTIILSERVAILRLLSGIKIILTTCKGLEFRPFTLSDECFIVSDYFIPDIPDFFNA